MSFCGTIGRYGGQFLAMAMHCHILQDPLMVLQDVALDRTPRKSKRAQPEDEHSQMQLFPVPIETREEFAKFARNIQFFMRENSNKARAHDVAYWREYSKLEYSGHEMYDFFRYFPDADLKLFSSQMEQVGSGEPLADYAPLIDFLSELWGHAMSMHESRRGGCF